MLHEEKMNEERYENFQSLYYQKHLVLHEAGEPSVTLFIIKYMGKGCAFL